MADAGSGGHVAPVLHKAVGEPADEGVARAGGIDHFYDVTWNQFAAFGARDEATAFAEGHDHDRRAEAAAKGVERSGRLGGERSLGVGGFFRREPEQVHQGDELRFVRDEDGDVTQQGGIEISPHRGGIEQSGYTSAAGGAQGMGDRDEAGFELGDDELRAFEQGWRQVARAERGVGPQGDHDLVLAGVVHQDGGGAGGKAGLGHEARGELVFRVKSLRDGRKGVRPDRAYKEHVGPGATGRHRLVGALAARAGSEDAERGLTSGGKRGATPGEILHVATNNDHSGFSGHGVKKDQPATQADAAGRDEAEKVNAPGRKRRTRAR